MLHEHIGRPYPFALSFTSNAEWNWWNL